MSIEPNAINVTIPLYQNRSIRHPLTLSCAIVQAIFRNSICPLEQCASLPHLVFCGTAEQKYIHQLPLSLQIELYKLWASRGLLSFKPSNLQLLYRHASKLNDSDAMVLFANLGPAEKRSELEYQKLEYQKLDQDLQDACDEINKNGHWTRWQNASEDERIIRVKELLKQGANPNVNEDTLEDTPLLQAMGQGTHQLAITLLNAGANPNHFNNKGQSPLGAIGGGYKNKHEHPRPDDEINEIYSALLMAGADLNATDSQGRTALMWVAASCTVQTVQRLVADGANIHAVTTQGVGACDYAKKNLHRESVVEYLQSLT